MVKVLGTPSRGRCCFIRTWPTPGILTLPLPRGLPGPTQFPFRHTWGKVKLSHQPRPRKRGYPAFSPRFTREKKPWKARSSRFRVSCKTWAYTSRYSGLTALTSPKSRICSYSVTDFLAFFQASRRSCKAALYSSRVRSRICTRAASWALVGCRRYTKAFLWVVCSICVTSYPGDAGLGVLQHRRAVSVPSIQPLRGWWKGSMYPRIEDAGHYSPFHTIPFPVERVGG